MQKDRYLFRGQKVDAKEWVYGYYMFHETKNKHVILTKESKFIEVIPESVGQITGVVDKNGMGLTEVYEGDIIDENGIIKGSIYEMDKRETDIVIPQLRTKAWDSAYKEAVVRGFDYSE